MRGAISGKPLVHVAEGRLITLRRPTTRRFHTQPDTWRRERIVEAMPKFRREIGRWRRSTDWAIACEDLSSAGTVYNRFGGWQAAVDIAIGG